MRLKYLFEVEFFDDKPKYKQNSQDASVKFPPVPNEKGILQGKSAFHDIREDVENGNVKRFTLVEQGLVILPRKFTVDLSDGHFEVNGVPFIAMGAKPLPIRPQKFTLKYFRVRTPYQTSTYANKTGQLLKRETGEFPIQYLLGWECEISGVHYEQVIVVS
jgi:hypothetical protein